MPQPRFEDVHPAFDAGDNYRVTNEEPELFREILRGKSLHRTGGIASAGEVPLFALLPYSESVVAVDHTYRSLAVCYIKALLLDALGAEGCRALLLDKSYQEFLTALQSLHPKMPAVLQSQMLFAPQPPTFTEDDWRKIRKEWVITPLSLMRRARRRLGKLTLIHGDLTDLNTRGPFDALYISNAMDKSSRTGKSIKAHQLLPALKEGGLLLSVTQVYQDPRFKEVRNIRYTRSTTNYWNHYAYEKVQEVTAAAVVPSAGMAVQV